MNSEDNFIKRMEQYLAPKLEKYKDLKIVDNTITESTKGKTYEIGEVQHIFKDKFSQAKPDYIPYLLWGVAFFAGYIFHSILNNW